MSRCMSALPDHNRAWRPRVLSSLTLRISERVAGDQHIPLGHRQRAVEGVSRCHPRPLPYSFSGIIRRSGMSRAPGVKSSIHPCDFH